MEQIKFRTLTPEDIEIRIGQKSEKMTMFLLYKNARVDMNILDETVGQDKWHRDHKELKGNLFCGVGIEVAPDKVVWKWDCGTESNTEKEKGEASDSFKRACVNWGIGRELYTTPRIKIWNNKLKFNGNYLETVLAISEIEYDETRHITDLTIIDTETLEEKWKMKNGIVVIGVGASQETDGRKPLTPAMVKSGSVIKVVEYLAGFNPDNKAEYNQGIRTVERKYIIMQDALPVLENAVRAMRRSQNA